jgi:hypothetical protein
MFNPQALLAQQSINTTASFEVSSLVNILWSISTDQRVVQSVDLLGLSMSTLSVYLLCLHTYKSFKKEGLRPKAAEIILPVLLIGLLFNDVRYLKELNFATQNTVNSIKTPLNKVVKEGSRSFEQNHKSSGRSSILVDNINLSTMDATREAYVRESIIRYQNFFLIE